MNFTALESAPYSRRLEIANWTKRVSIGAKIARNIPITNKIALPLFSLFELLFFPVIKFIYSYIIQLGVLDGFAGLTMSYMMSIHSLCVRIKMYEKK